MGLNGTEYTVLTEKGLEPRKYDHNFSKLINDYLQDKIDYKIILDKKSLLIMLLIIMKELKYHKTQKLKKQ